MIGVGRRGCPTSKDGLDDGIPNGVEQPEIGARDHHEPERHGGALTDLAAIGPLDTAQLLPGRAQEVPRAAEEALAGPVHLVAVVTVPRARGALLGRLADGTARF